MVTLQRPSSPSTRRLTVRPHPGQARILASKAPVTAAIAGTGGGKTVCGQLWLIIAMTRRPNELWLVVEPTWQMVDRILLASSADRPGLLALLRYFDPGLIYNKSTRSIHSKLGTILLSSATHPESMEGAHVAGVWLDEAGQMSYLAYETAVRRVSFKNGPILITTTPYNRGWLFKEVYQKARQGDPNITVVQFPSTANPAYPRETFERNRANMSAARFRMMHEGGFERPEGMVYEGWDDRHFVEPFAVPAEWWRGAAIDFGWNHPTAAVWAARDDDGVYYLYQEHKKAQTLLVDHFKAIQQMSRNGAQPQAWYADPSAKQQRAELRQLGLPLRPANNDVLTGIDTVARLIAQDRLKVFNTCAHWLDEIESYIWTKTDEGPTDKPVKINDDLMDATRYLLHTVENRQQPHLYT